MKYTFEKEGKGTAKVSNRQFDSIQEFVDYIHNTPNNTAFGEGKHSSSTGSEKFTGTKNFTEALYLLRNGWKDMAQKLEVQLKAHTTSQVTKTSPRPVYAVAGYQACVPRYLQGVPESMIYSKRVPVKQKVLTINKQINYLAEVKAETIIEESVKALTIVAKLEAQGYRVNLNIVTCSKDWYGKHIQIVQVPIKKAAERIAVSKMAFPLVHPSMFRRLIFKYDEVNPDTPTSWVGGYGSTIYNASKYFEDKSKAVYYIPPFVGDIDAYIKKMELK